MSSESTHNVIVTRVFDAPVAQVFNAWKESGQVKRWWGPLGFTAPVANMDFRPGGSSLVSMKAPDEYGGMEIYNTWTYGKIEPNERIEFTLHFADASGNRIDPSSIGLPADIPDGVPHVITFKALGDNKTEMTVSEYGYGSAETAEGSKGGLEQTLDKLGRCLVNPTAARFVERLKAHQSDAELKKIQRYFKSDAGEYGEGDQFLGVRMGAVFALAKEFIAMPPDEIEKLLENPLHEARAGAVSIMNQQGRNKKTPESRRKELYDLYLRRHDRINNWDLVDLGAAYVVGAYLYDKPRAPLYKLARSKIMWERRTAIYSTYYFIRQGELDDTYKIAEMLLQDKEDLMHKAVGGWLRAAGGADRPRLLRFLDQHAAAMPRTMLRYAIEHLDKKQREHYMESK